MKHLTVITILIVLLSCHRTDPTDFQYMIKPMPEHCLAFEIRNLQKHAGYFEVTGDSVYFGGGIPPDSTFSFSPPGKYCFAFTEFLEDRTVKVRFYSDSCHPLAMREYLVRTY